MGFLDPKPQTMAGLDTAVRDKINLSGSATRTALNTAYVRVVTGLNSDDATDNRATIQAALDLGGRVIIPPTTGRYAIAGPLNVTVPGTTITATGAPLRQLTSAQSIFDITVADVTIDGVDAIGMSTTLNVTGMNTAWEMSILSSRWTVINAYKGADRLRIPWIRARGFGSAVRVTCWDKALGVISATHVADVEIGTILCSNVEFGIVAHGTDRLSYDLIKGSYVYPIGGTRAPHLIYFSGSAADNLDLSAGVGIATFDGGANGQAFQFKGVLRGEVRSLEANACPGVLNVMDCQDLNFGPISSIGDTCVDPYGSLSMSANAGTLERISLDAVKIRMASDGIPFRTLSGDRTRVRDLDVEVTHTTSGTLHDVSIAGTNTDITRLNIRNVGASNSWRGLGLWSGDGHRVGQYKATNVRFGIDVRSTATNAVIGYDSADVTVHPTDGVAKIIVDPTAAPTLRLPGKPDANSRTKVLDKFNIGPLSGTAFGVALTGQSWTVQTGTWVVSTSTGEAYESGNVAQSNAYVDSGMANVELRASVKLKAFDGLMLRRVGTTEYVCVYISLTGVMVAKRDLGALTTLASGPAVTYQAGRWYSLKVQVYGTKIDVYVDNVFSVSHTLAGGDDTKFLSSTQHGLFCSASGGLNKFKEFEVIQL